MDRILKQLMLTKRVMQDQKGQALPLVLVFLLVGGLTITPALDNATTSLMACRTSEENVNGFFAADAGVQYAVWCLDNSISPPTQLSEPINGMNVTLQVTPPDQYTLYFGELIQADSHSNYLGVSGEIVWDEPAQAYKYTITITWEPDSGAPTIHLEGLGARMPVDYVYQTGSAAGFVDNLSLGEPSEVTDGQGAYLLNWEFAPPLPSVSQANPVVTQTFYATGEGDLEGHYAWVVANRDDIGAIGEVSGNLYTVTVTATRVDTAETTSEIVAGVLLQEVGEVTITSIVSWQVLK